MIVPDGQYYEFGPYRLDVVRRLLLRESLPVPLTSKAFDTLLALVGNSGEILEKEDLLNRIWPDAVVEEKNLTVTISTLRKALGETPNQHQFIVTVPGKGYKFVAAVKELMAEDADLIIEKQITAQIIVEEEPHEIEANEPYLLSTSSRFRLPRLTAGRIAIVLIILLAVAAVVYFQFSRRSNLSGRDVMVGSLAVLPFKSLGTEGVDQYLGLGVTDALITRLSNISEIIVRPTRAVRKYADMEQDAASVGQELKVDSVLEGNIQRFGDHIRVTVQLINVKDSKPLLGETFDEKFTNVFALEDSISRRLVEALKLKLTSHESQRLVTHNTENAEAYRLYLKGRYYSSNWSVEGFHKAVGYFNDAIAVDPTYALAYAGLADTYYRHATVHIPLQEAVPKARAAAMEALRLDDALAEAHTSLGMIKFRYDWDWVGAENEFKRAIDLNQNYATAHQWYSEYLTAMGRGDEAVAEAKRGEQIDPLSPEVGWGWGFALFFARRYDQAVEQFSKTIELNPKFWLPHSFLGWCYGEKGEFDKAFAEYEKARALDDNEDTLSHLASIYVKAGKRSQAQKVLDELIQRAKRKYVSPFFIAAVYISLGEKKQGLEWLEKAYEERSELLVFIKVAPNFDGIRAEPEFVEVMKRIGLSSEGNP
jgi:DNA-binding winged helix-turn-helix (wHTH) protein/TolB-like protein